MHFGIMIFQLPVGSSERESVVRREAPVSPYGAGATGENGPQEGWAWPALSLRRQVHVVEKAAGWKCKFENVGLSAPTVLPLGSWALTGKDL